MDEFLGFGAVVVIIALVSAGVAKLRKVWGDSKFDAVAACVSAAVRKAEELFPNDGVKRGAEKFEFAKRIIVRENELLSADYVKKAIETAVAIMKKGGN